VSRALPPGRYGWRDLAPGDWWRTGGIVVTEAHVVGFAGLSGDFFDLHMDDAAARGLGFPARVAHGLLVLSLADGLKNRAPVQLDAVASLGWEWQFRAPVLIGDRIAARLDVRAVRPVREGGRGLLTLGLTVTRQDGTTVQEGLTRLMMRGPG
jgi:acyl dehydratase